MKQLFWQNLYRIDPSHSARIYFFVFTKAKIFVVNHTKYKKSYRYRNVKAYECHFARYISKNDIILGLNHDFVYISVSQTCVYHDFSVRARTQRFIMLLRVALEYCYMQRLCLWKDFVLQMLFSSLLRVRASTNIVCYRMPI